MRKRKRSASSSWIEAVNTGWATWMTLSVRVPQLMTGTMTPAEAHRMVVEKCAAVSEGTMGAGLAAQRIALRRNAVPGPAALIRDMTAITEAALRPARRRVKANAKRLSAASSTRRHGS